MSITALEVQRSPLQRLKDTWHQKTSASVSFPMPLGALRMVKVAFEPSSLPLYERLIPYGLSMPRTPRLQVELMLARPGWCEGSVSIACRHGDEDGWLGLYWPIDSWLGYKGGRWVGYPKHMAQRMRLWQEGELVRGEVFNRGRSEMTLTFRPGASSHEPSRKLAEALVGPERERPVYLQVPPARGPSLNRLTFDEGKPLKTQLRPGTAHVSFDVDAPWVALIPQDGRSESATYIERSGRGLGWLIAKRIAPVEATLPNGALEPRPMNLAS